MPELDLDAIRGRANAATRGPWEADEWEIYGESRTVWIGETCSADDLPQSRANGEFIAHAREDVPALLDKINEQKTTIDWAMETIKRLKGELIRETHGHEPGLCDEYRCSSCRYCGREKPCGCSLATPEPVEHIKMKCPVCLGETYRKSTDDEGERWEAHYKSSPSCRP